MVPEYDVAFSTVHTAYYRPLCYYANGIVEDPVEARMIVNDVFTEAFEKRENFADGKKIYPLLRVISVSLKS